MMPPGRRRRRGRVGRRRRARRRRSGPIMVHPAAGAVGSPTIILPLARDYCIVPATSFDWYGVDW